MIDIGVERGDLGGERSSSAKRVLIAGCSKAERFARRAPELVRGDADAADFDDVAGRYLLHLFGIEGKAKKTCCGMVVERPLHENGKQTREAAWYKSMWEVSGITTIAYIARATPN